MVYPAQIALPPEALKDGIPVMRVHWISFASLYLDLIACFKYLRADRSIALAFLSGITPDKIISSYTPGT